MKNINVGDRVIHPESGVFGSVISVMDDEQILVYTNDGVIFCAPMVNFIHSMNIF